ncbi:Hpt domain-containing protein, partial [Vibrio splendidus]|uniref:Hpt domain-containing protein n=1 Tax=Vibrio splendidus TaxID=29497 RepID=UPI003D0BD36B
HITLVLWGVRSRKLIQQTDKELSPEPLADSSKENALSAVRQPTNDPSVLKITPTSKHSDLQAQEGINVASQEIVQQNTEEAPVAEKHIASVTDSKPAIDIEDMLETLDGDAESVELLLGVFVQDHADDYTKFKSLLTKDETSAARIVHSLKGVAGSIKASRLAIIAATIEMTMKQSRAISEHDLEELEAAIKASIDAAFEYLDKQR